MKINGNLFQNRTAPTEEKEDIKCAQCHGRVLFRAPFLCAAIHCTDCVMMPRFECFSICATHSLNVNMITVHVDVTQPWCDPSNEFAFCPKVLHHLGQPYGLTLEDMRTLDAREWLEDHNNVNLVICSRPVKCRRCEMSR